MSNAINDEMERTLIDAFLYSQKHAKFLGLRLEVFVGTFRLTKKVDGQACIVADLPNMEMVSTFLMGYDRGQDQTTPLPRVDGTPVPKPEAPSNEPLKEGGT